MVSFFCLTSLDLSVLYRPLLTFNVDFTCQIRVKFTNAFHMRVKYVSMWRNQKIFRVSNLREAFYNVFYMFQLRVKLFTMYFSRFNSAGSFLQCFFCDSTQREAFCNVFSVFQLRVKLSTMFFPCFNSAGSFLQCFFRVSTQSEAFYNVFSVSQLGGRLSTLFFSCLSCLLIAVNR
jgi:hypothetical protein